jgi:hypothetical protein
MALGSIQPVSDKSTKVLPLVLRGRGVKVAGA